MNLVPASVVDILLNYLASQVKDVYQMDDFEALDKVLTSQTFSMILDDDKKLWYFAPPALWDILKCEFENNSPYESIYLKEDL